MPKKAAHVAMRFSGCLATLGVSTTSSVDCGGLQKVTMIGRPPSSFDGSIEEKFVEKRKSCCSKLKWLLIVALDDNKNNNTGVMFLNSTTVMIQKRIAKSVVVIPEREREKS